MPESEENPKSQSSGAQAGRGGLALAGGKIYFLVTGLVQQIALKAILGLSGYGAYSTATSIASIAYNPLIQSGVQGVSREIAGATETAAPQQLRSLLGFHALVALGSSITFFFAADALTRWLGAPHLLLGLRWLSVILFLYGLYAPLIGFLNGRRRFLGQAGLDVLSATLRTLGLVGGAWAAARWLQGSDPLVYAGKQVEATAIGFIIAAALVVGAAFRLTGRGKPGGANFSWKTYGALVLRILFGQLMLNLLFQTDALLLRKFAAQAVFAGGQLPELADGYVGAYRASQLFCFLPFQLLTSVTFVLFPLLAAAKASGNREEVARLVARGLRFATLVAGLIVSTIVSMPGGLLRVVFGVEVAVLGENSMPLLAVGMGFFALLGVIASALNSLGHERRTLLVLTSAVVMVVVFCFVLAPQDSLSPLLLSRVAMATSLAMILTTLLAAQQLRMVAGAQVSLLSLGRTMLGVALASLVVTRVFPLAAETSRQAAILPTIGGVILSLFIFIGFLVVSRELKQEDASQLRSLFSKK